MALSGIIESSTTTADGHLTSDYWPRRLVFEWSATQNIANNTSTISYTLRASGDNTHAWTNTGVIKVVLNGTTIYNQPGKIKLYGQSVLKTGTMTITHSNDGSKTVSLTMEAGFYSYSTVNSTYSGSFTLDTIPRAAKVVSAPNFNDEANPTITYSNPAGDAVSSLQACISLDGSAADIPYRDISKTGTTYTFNLTDAERATLRNATRNANSRTVKFHVKTVIGSNTFYESIPKTLTIVNAAPTLTVDAVDTNATTIALTGDAHKYIRYYSNVKATATATGNKGATITSTTGAGTFNKVDHATFNFKTTDSRGNSTEKTYTGTLIPYVYLTANFKPRVSVNGEVVIDVKGNYYNGSFGAVANTLTLQYRYKQANGSYTSWANYTPSISGNEHDTAVTFTIPNFDYQSRYTFQVKVSDKLATITPNEYAASALPVFDWSATDFNFNVPVSIGGNLTIDGTPLVDFVVDAGTSGIWTYRMWNSGIAECWGTVAPAAHSITTAWGNIYTKDNAIARQSYPFTFIDVPVVSMNLYNTTGNCWSYTGTVGSASMSPAFGLARGTSGNVTTGAQITAIGRWK